MYPSSEEFVSFEIDEFIASQDTTIYIVTLSDGSTVYEDDLRPGYKDPAWIRLGNYCRKRNLHIVGMKIKFRSNVVELPSNKDGYYFTKSALGSFFYNVKRLNTKTRHHYLIGYYENGLIHVEKYKVPELLLVEKEIRFTNLIHEGSLIARQQQEIQVPVNG